MHQRLYSTAEAARLLGVTTGRVRQLADALGLGQRVDGRTRLFSAADLETLRARNTRPGRPRTRERS